MTTPVPPEAITAAARPVCEHYWAFHLHDGLSVRLCQLCHEPDWDDVRDELAKARAEGAAAGRDRCIQLITGKRDEFADHARQARALPKTAETLALRADTLSEIIGLLRGKP